jgi:phosphatase NudJ
VRVIFGAEPLADEAPKQEPDEHSLKAGWFSLGEAAALPLRGREVLLLLSAALAGAPLYPLSLLGDER